MNDVTFFQLPLMASGVNGDPMEIAAQRVGQTVVKWAIIVILIPVFYLVLAD